MTVRIEPDSGLVAPSGRLDAIFEIFEQGHVPELAAEDTGSGFEFGFDSDDGLGEYEDEDESLF